ncbi:hypothetical protein E2C01_048180 [Portunus trituberculatus]|uniref:Uncharacterized protein n=1 Tax=Portunus trituberculatus TaxID=210409 RepID=A0A5B7G2H0_PORTR|nr:hypothetical protein [Portunus trituberculatus]
MNGIKYFNQRNKGLYTPPKLHKLALSVDALLHTHRHPLASHNTVNELQRTGRFTGAAALLVSAATPLPHHPPQLMIRRDNPGSIMPFMTPRTRTLTQTPHA